MYTKKPISLTRSSFSARSPIFVVVNTLLLCSPPALTLAQITSAGASGGSFERLISRTIFWSYCVLTPLVMLGSVLGGLWLAELWGLGLRLGMERWRKVVDTESLEPLDKLGWRRRGVGRKGEEVCRALKGILLLSFSVPWLAVFLALFLFYGMLCFLGSSFLTPCASYSSPYSSPYLHSLFFFPFHHIIFTFSFSLIETLVSCFYLSTIQSGFLLTYSQ